MGIIVIKQEVVQPPPPPPKFIYIRDGKTWYREKFNIIIKDGEHVDAIYHNRGGRRVQRSCSDLLHIDYTKNGQKKSAQYTITGLKEGILGLP